jgi:hypothetical protein
MAKIAPITTIHHGRLEGRLNASKTPVTIADPSLILTGVFRIYSWISISARTHDAIDTAVIISAPIPNKYTVTKKAGIKETTTPTISLFTERSLLICGEGETVKSLLIVFFGF